MSKRISLSELSEAGRVLGRKGGLAVLQRYGHQHFVEIGRRGQLSLRQRHPGMASQWGAKGGRPRKLGLEHMGGESKRPRKEDADPPQHAFAPLNYSS
jgi:hypothetical protein